MDSPKVNMFFFPQVYGGHLLPMVDVARVFAAHGAKSTIITTSINALSFQNTIENDRQIGHDIDFHIIPSPTAEVDLPDGGCENHHSATSVDMSKKFASGKLQGSVEKLLEDQRPDCLVSDMFFPWTADVAKKLGIPRIAFYGTGSFFNCAQESLRRHKPHEKVSSDKEPFALPGLPDKIEFTRLTIPDWFLNPTGAEALFLDMILKSELISYGVIVNSFLELEQAYADYYIQEVGMKLCHIGPVSLCNKNASNKFERGLNTSAIDNHQHSCLSWLDSKEPNTVLYISFGSMPQIAPAQLLEIAYGLEASNHQFVWVVGKILQDVNDSTIVIDDWLPEGFIERMTSSKRGMIIQGWAPQLLILEHAALGGFLTHCGWNSLIEGVSAGLPMITWPLKADQFFNEKFLVDVLKVGIPVGTEKWTPYNAPEVTVSREKVTKAVDQLMDVKEDKIVEMRRRVRELGEKARRAVEKGGSSYKNVDAFIDELKSN